MGKFQAYFPNHGRTSTFPWTLYHRPLKEDLLAFLHQHGSPAARLLVVGPGDFEEFSEVKTLVGSVSVLDIDPRVLDRLKTSLGSEITSYHLATETFDGYPDEVDLIVGKEVIEHIPETEAFLTRLQRSLRPGGKLWLSTPDYGFVLLPFLEATFLELVARLQGYSRRHIHPVKFTATTLARAFEARGWRLLRLRRHALRLSLSVWAEKE